MNAPAGCRLAANGKAVILVDADVYASSVRVQALTAAEVEVLELAASGLSDREIALATSRSKWSVKWTTAGARRKLGVERTSEAVLALLRAGVIE